MRYQSRRVKPGSYTLLIIARKLLIGTFSRTLGAGAVFLGAGTSILVVSSVFMLFEYLCAGCPQRCNNFAFINIKQKTQ
jgi:hypothetical protein